MKYLKIMLLVLFALPFAVKAQTANPNADKAMEKYTDRLENHESTMGETQQDTYTARDPRQEKIDERQDRRYERREFRRDLRMTRAQRPFFQPVGPYRNNSWMFPY